MNKRSFETLDPKSDVVFKSLFSRDCDESHIARNSLIGSFLNREVKESALIPNEPAGRDFYSKHIRLDLNCVLDDKSHVIVEMQMQNYQDDLAKRLVYYASRVFSNQEAKGNPYLKIKNVYTILIGNYNIFESKDYFSKFELICNASQTVLSDALVFYFLELKKLPKMLRFDKELGVLQQWAYFFRDANTKALDDIVKVDRGIKMAESILNQISQDYIERINLIREEIAYRDHISRIYHFKREGLEEGLAKGKESQKLEIAQNMKAKGYSAKDILDITGLEEGSY